MKEWISTNVDAQCVGLIVHEFGYSLEYIGELTPFQFDFLIAWLNWWSEKQKRRVRFR
jgi:hypothetical protein